MKKLILSFTMVLLSMGFAVAQKIAYIDSDYILSNISEYTAAQKALSQQAEAWQKEVNDSYNAIETAYNNYQKNRTSLSAEKQRAQEEAIINQENKAKELQKKYFGQDGSMAKLQEEKIQPIIKKVNDVIKSFAIDKGYDLVFDTANDASIVYFNARNDHSDEILRLLGVK